MNLKDLLKLIKKPSFWRDGLAFVGLIMVLIVLYVLLWAIFEAPAID